MGCAYYYSGERFAPFHPEMGLFLLKCGSPARKEIKLLAGTVIVAFTLVQGFHGYPPQYVDALELVNFQTPFSLRRVKSPWSRQLCFPPPYTAAITRLLPVIAA